MDITCITATKIMMAFRTFGPGGKLLITHGDIKCIVN
jgi:hypothetical protein